MKDSYLAWVSLTFLNMAPATYGRIWLVYNSVRPLPWIFPNAKSNLLLDSNRFDWRVHYVVRRCGLVIEDIEHARDALETEHVISSFVQYFEVAEKA
jgi:hypothetical protein